MAQTHMTISPTIMLCLLILPLITLCYATNNSSSGKPSGNMVSLLCLTSNCALFSKYNTICNRLCLDAVMKVGKEHGGFTLKDRVRLSPGYDPERGRVYKKFII